jgi:phosphatidylserine decarboxylase
LYLKGKFFEFEELLGRDKARWHRIFASGDYAVFRLTPDKYHYNHTPVAGQVVDFYEVPGAYHSCNPRAVIDIQTPFSKNRRTVTVFQTDVPGGTQVGFVAMVEIVALGIGDITQCYSETEYQSPSGIYPGMFLRKGQPKSIFRPGSSTNVLVFQPHRVRFAVDILQNMSAPGSPSLYSKGFGKPLLETEVSVRSRIAEGIKSDSATQSLMKAEGEKW